MTNRFLPLVPLLVPLPVAAPLAAQDEDPARLLPANAVAVVRVESARALEELMRAFSPDAQPSDFDLQAKLDSVATYEAQAAGELARLDRERPLYFALSVDPATGPGWALVVPVSNGKELAIHETFGTTTSATLGAWCGVSNRADYSVSPTPCPLASQLRPGLVSARVDLATLIATFRPLIDTGLRQAEAGLDQMPSEAFDVQPIAEQSFEMAREFLDDALSLDASLERAGSRLALLLGYESRRERALSTAATPDVVAALLGRIDPESAAQMVLTGKWTSMLAPFEDLVDAALEAYPEPFRADLAGMVRAFRALDPLLLPGGAMSFDIGPGGMRFAYVLRSSRPGEVVAQLEAMLRALDREGGFLRVGAAEPLVVGGLEARALPLTLEPEALVRAMGEGAEPDPEMAAHMRATFDAMYGRDLRFALSVQGELVLAALAGDAETLRADLARLRAGGAPAPELARLVERAGSGAPGFAYRVDVGRATRRMFEAMRELMPPEALPVLPDAPMSIDLWGAGTARGWSGGLALDVGELVAFARAMRLLQPR